MKNRPHDEFLMAMIVDVRHILPALRYKQASVISQNPTRMFTDKRPEVMDALA